MTTSPVVEEKVQDLTRVFALAQHLGNPQIKLPSYIHIGGVSGKSSVVHLLSHMLINSCPGCRVGTFIFPPSTSWDYRTCIQMGCRVEGAVGGPSTSTIMPPIWSSTYTSASSTSKSSPGQKTFRTVDEPLSMGQLHKAVDGAGSVDPCTPIDQNLFDRFKSLADGSNRDHQLNCSHYEVLFLTALLVFEHIKCDIVVIESALGGEWDASNIMDRFMTLGNQIVNCETSSLLALGLTTITMDHIHHLGKTREEIAAGILHLWRPTSKADILIQDYGLSSDTKASIMAHSPCVQFLSNLKDQIPNHTDLILRLDTAYHAANIDMALALYASCFPRLKCNVQQPAESSIPKRDSMFSPRLVRSLVNVWQVPGRFAKFQYRGKRIIVDAAENADSPIFLLPDVVANTNERIHIVLGLSGAKEMKQHRELISVFGCSSQYRFSFVNISIPPHYPWIRPANSQLLHEVILKNCQAENVEPNITHYTTIAEVLADTACEPELVVILGSPHVVVDFFQQIVQV